MYSDKLAVAIKHNGKVLREFKDTVLIPFGSEYSIFVKNLNTVRCQFKIEIDGTDIADGDEFIVNAGQEITIERFLKNGNVHSGNRFKFIERTAKVEQHRGVGAEDGLIRILYEFEKQPTQWGSNYIVSSGYSGPTWGNGTPRSFGPEFISKHDGATCSDYSGSLDREIKCAADLSYQGNLGSCSTSSAYAAGTQKSLRPSPELLNNARNVNDAGITVAGSISEQKFQNVSGINSDGVQHVMVLKLVGEVGQELVQQPITVKAKPKCSTCGKQNKATSKFCSECGTSLEIL